MPFTGRIKKTKKHYKGVFFNPSKLRYHTLLMAFLLYKRIDFMTKVAGIHFMRTKFQLIAFADCFVLSTLKIVYF